MECIIHPDREAVDVCRSCGKPLCVACGDASTSRFICANCRVGDKDPSWPGLAERSGRPLLAALISIVPGLGYLVSGHAAKAATVFGAIGFLLYCAVVDDRMAGFAACLWLYQIVDAYRDAKTPSAPPMVPATPHPASASRAVTWLLIAGGAALLFQNLAGANILRLPVLLPLLFIGAGLRLLFTYFRSEDAPT